MNYKKSHPHYGELEISNYEKARLRLVEPKIEYAKISLTWTSNHEIVQYMGADFSNPSLEKEIERLQKIIDSKDEYNWMIEVDGKIIGNVALHDIQEKSTEFGVKAATFTILIGDKKYWGQGIGGHVTRAILDWAFNQGDFEVIFSRALEQNIGSLKALSNEGFENVGTTPCEILINGQHATWQNFKLTKARYMEKLEIIYRSRSLKISYFLRRGQKETLLYLHGLGCRKDDFSNALQSESLEDYTHIAFDFPGHGESGCLENLGMDDLVEITNLFVEKLNLHNVVLVGHSVGGLIALLFSEKYPEKVKAFINVEGNLNADDCFFSREVIKHSYEDFLSQGCSEIKRLVAEKKNIGFEKFSSHLQKINPRAYYDYCPSMTEYSTQGNLVEKFIEMKIPRLFIYGSENAHLVYLKQLRDSGIQVAEIADSDHWPMHDNPQGFYGVISNFLNGK